MKRKVHVGFALGVGCIAVLGSFEIASTKTATVSAISPGCRSPDAFAWNFKDWIISAMSQTNAATDLVVASRGLIRVPVSQVEAVTDAATCVRAANAYSSAINDPDSTRQVHAVRAGIRYLVIDPAVGGGGYRAGVTFDSSFTQIYKVFGY